MILDTDKPVTQDTFATLIGVGRTAVTALLGEGLLLRDGTLGDWLVAYCSRIREQAAGRASTGGLSLATERARLARVQADLREAELAKLRGELIEVGAMELVLASVGTRATAILEAVPSAIKRAAPEASARVLAIVEQEISRACNEVAELEMPVDVQLGNLDARARGD